MMLSALILALPASVAAQPAATQPAAIGMAGDLLAIRARRVESVTQGTLEHAVILIEGGKITAIGEDLPIERGIPIWDLPEEWVVMPGLVDAYTRLGMDGQGYTDSRGNIRASDELYPADPGYKKALEAGVTTLGEYPAGTGIPGKAVAIRPKGQTPEEMILADDAYLKIVMRSMGSSKRNISNGFEKADEYLEKEKKNREKWESDQEKKKKKSSKSTKSKDDEKKDDEKKDEEKEKEDESKSKKDESPDVYVPLEPDPQVAPFLALRSGELRALVAISQAGDWLHLLDAIGKETFAFDLRVTLTRSADIFHVKDEIAKRGCRVLFEPTLTWHPGTMRERNLPAEFARAGVPLVLLPQSDNSLADWRADVGEIVATGLDRQVALRAITQEPAELLGLGDRVGSLAVGKDANLLILSGDPFEPGTKVEHVLLDGKFVHGAEVKL